MRNLVASDLGVGFVELAFVAYWVSILQGQWQMSHYFYRAYIIGAYTSISVSLWTLAAISVDRFLVLFLGLRYRQVVTLRRVYIVVIALWVLIGMGSAILAMLFPIMTGIVSVTGSIMCLMAIFSATPEFSSGCVINQLKFTTIFQNKRIKQYQ